MSELWWKCGLVHTKGSWLIYLATLDSTNAVPFIWLYRSFFSIIYYCQLRLWQYVPILCAYICFYWNHKCFTWGWFRSSRSSDITSMPHALMSPIQGENSCLRLGRPSFVGCLGRWSLVATNRASCPPGHCCSFPPFAHICIHCVFLAITTFCQISWCFGTH